MPKTSDDFEIDEEKAIKIARILLELHKQKDELISMPEYQLPKNLTPGTREHALYLTYIISIDYMTDAERLWRKARETYEQRPECFTPEKIPNISECSLQIFLRDLGARFWANAARSWKKISRILMEKYSGDPRNITKEPSTVAEIKLKLQSFPYLSGPKLTNFYIRAMGETGLFKVKNLDELDIPVDKQVTRFTAYTGVIKLRTKKFSGSANDDPLRSMIQKAWRNAAKTYKIAPWKLDEPIWNIGSKLCTSGKCNKCPIETHCNRNMGITFKDNILYWENR